MGVLASADYKCQKEQEDGCMCVKAVNKGPQLKAINRAFCWTRLLVTPTAIICIIIHAPYPK